MALDRETVVRTALRVLNDVGLDGLTLRKIAAELHVQAPALYWHFKNKQALLDEMATTVFADAFSAGQFLSDDGEWADWLTAYGKGLRQLMLRYRDGAKMLSGTYLTDNRLYASMEIALRRYTAAGFSLRDAIVGLGTIYSYAVGFTIEEQAAFSLSGARNEQYDPEKRAERIDSQQFPLALAAGEHMFTNLDERFEQGLQVIIKGLRQDLV